MNINRQTYEEFFLLYIDNELTNEERRKVEDFMWQHPDLRGEMEMLKATIFTAENDIVFDNKEELYRKEEERKLVPFAWWRIAAAAAVVLFLATAAWLYLGTEGEGPEAATPALSGKHGIKGNRDRAPSAPQAEPGPGSIADGQPKETEAPAPAGTSAEPGRAETTKREAAASTGVRPSRNIAAAPVRETKRSRETVVSPDEPTNTTGEPPVIDIASTPEPAVFDQPMAITAGRKQKVNVPVEPQALQDSEYAINTNTDQHYADYAHERSDKDIIYFANTSISKKNKLRVVFRKATRIIDKVTSIQ